MSFKIVGTRVAHVHWRGHVGAALVAFAPVGAVLSASGEFALALLGTAVAVAVATLPDVDEALPMAHRGWTHTVWFVAGCGVLAAALGAAAGVAVGRPLAVAVAVGLATGVSLAAHIAADSVTPMGVRPLYPVSRWHHSFDVTPARNPRANATLLGFGVLTAVAAHAVVVL